MKSVDIFDKRWLDVVFEGRNQEYGAYQLRRENTTTTLFAFLIGVAILGIVVGSSMLSRNVSPALAGPIIDILPNTPVVLAHINPPQNEPPKQPETVAVPLTRNDEDPVQLENPVVARTIEAEQNIATNTNNATTVPTLEGGTSTGSLTAPPQGTGSTTVAVPGPDNSLNILASLDKLPEFPGGIEKFYNYVSKNFEQPETNTMKTVRVYVSFVIEKDGKMTDITVPNDPGYGLGKEAVRVLKSLRTKWKPGVIKGQPVRTAYSLPITVVMN